MIYQELLVIHKYSADTHLHRYLSVLNSLSFLDDGKANVFLKAYGGPSSLSPGGERGRMQQINQQAVRCAG